MGKGADCCWIEGFSILAPHFHRYGIFEDETAPEIERIQLSPKERFEKPVSHYGYPLKILDCYMTVCLHYPYYATTSEYILLFDDSEYHVKHGFDAKNFDLYHFDIKTRGGEKRFRTSMFNLLIDIKPNLDTISSILNQINVYRNIVPRALDETVRPDNLKHDEHILPLRTVILTIDNQPTKYDNFLLGQGINVYRIPKSEVDYYFHGYKEKI
jgi:hypothetical protein